MAREILVHLNVSASDEDPRTANEIADDILEAAAFPPKGIPGDPRTVNLKAVCPLAEEI